MADRRRINGPGGITVAPVYEADEFAASTRTRAPNGIRSQCEFPIRFSQQLVVAYCE